MNWIQGIIILIAVFLKVYKSENIKDSKALDSAVFLLIISVVLPTIPMFLSPIGLDYLTGESGWFTKAYLFVNKCINVLNGIIIAIAVHKLWKSIGTPKEVVEEKND